MGRRDEGLSAGLRSLRGANLVGSREGGREVAASEDRGCAGVAERGELGDVGLVGGGQERCVGPGGVV